MPQLKTVLWTNVSVFSLVGMLQLSRLIFGWYAQLGSWEVPLWINGVALMLAAIMLTLNIAHLRKTAQRRRR